MGAAAKAGNGSLEEDQQFNSSLELNCYFFQYNSKVYNCPYGHFMTQKSSKSIFLGGREKGLIACFAVSCQLPKAPCQSS